MKINERNYNIRFTGKTLLVYKEEFNQDMLLSLEKGTSDTITFLKLMWSLLKTCDDSFPPFREWADSLSMSEITNILQKENIDEMTKLFARDKVGTKEIKKN